MSYTPDSHLLNEPLSSLIKAIEEVIQVSETRMISGEYTTVHEIELMRLNSRLSTLRSELLLLKRNVK